MIEKIRNNDTLVIFIHGIYENSKRYENLSDIFLENNIDFISIEYEKNMFDTKKLNDLYEKNFKKYNKIYILGHSLGSNLALKLAIENSKVNNLILTGMPLLSGVNIFFSKLILKIEMLFKKNVTILNKSFRRYNNKFSHEKEFSWLNRNQDEVNNIISDYTFQEPSPQKLLQILDNMKYIKKNIKKINDNINILILSGTNDVIVDKEKIKKHISKLLNENSNIVYVNVLEARHDILKEYNQDRVINRILEWIKYGR